MSASSKTSLTRIAGKDDVKKFDVEDLVSLKKDLSEITGVKWIDGKNY